MRESDLTAYERSLLWDAIEGTYVIEFRNAADDPPSLSTDDHRRRVARALVHLARGGYIHAYTAPWGADDSIKHPLSPEELKERLSTEPTAGLDPVTSLPPGTRLFANQARLLTFGLSTAVREYVRSVPTFREWLHPERPEDPAFFRADGTLLAGSVAHEGFLFTDPARRRARPPRRTVSPEARAALRPLPDDDVRPLSGPLDGAAPTGDATTTPVWQEWREHYGLPELGWLLFRVWDPMGLYGDSGFLGEYDDYAEPVLAALEQGASAEELARRLERIAADVIGVPNPDTRAAEAATAVVAWYADVLNRLGPRLPDRPEGGEAGG